MKSPRRPQTHELQDIYEDLTLWGDAVWRSECTCGWVSRPATDPGVTRGLWRRHIKIAGR